MSVKNSPKTNVVALYLAFAVLGIFVLLPFHALLSTWLGSVTGNLDLIRAWKEIIIIAMAIGVAFLLAIDKPLRKEFLNSLLVKAIAVYTVFTLLRAVYGVTSGEVTTEATFYALLNNLRYLGFFLVVWLIAKRSQILEHYWQKAVVAPAAAVVTFGLLQQLVLDKDSLTYFGYGTGTTLAPQAVDLKPEYIRIQSTLRGPNPLGAYLVFFVTYLLGAIIKASRFRVLHAVLTLASICVLFFTYSRSAWFGLMVSVVVLVCLLAKTRGTRVMVVGFAVGVLVAMAGSATILRTNSTFQNIIFHTDDLSVSSQSSNEVRANALVNGIQDTINNPLGSGPGSAGPASFRNNNQPKIAENYYIQLAQEVGVIGLVLYLLITLILVRGLWLRRQQLLPAVLLATLAGITCINMLSHAWADDTLSLLWWGLAGIAISYSPDKPLLSKPAILKANKSIASKNRVHAKKEKNPQKPSPRD